MNKNILISVGAFVGGVTLGATAAYFITRKYLDDYYHEQAEDEIAEMRDHYARKNKGEGYSTPEEAAQTLGVSVETEQYVPSMEDILGAKALVDLAGYNGQAIPEKEEPKETPILVNGAPFIPEDESIWSKDEPQDPSTELKDELFIDRDEESGPFVITLEEFMTDHSDEENGDYDKESLIWWDGDGQLSAPDESLVPDIEFVVGNKNLSFFGRGSKDPNMLYIRNKAVGTDFEIVRHETSYMATVLGIEDDEPADKRVRKMRDDE